MLRLRRAAERGQADHGWLKTAHTFSFADYFDPAHMGFRSLRVMNEDRVAPGQGFGAHSHRDMEVLSYVLEGELEHRDSLGNGSVLRPGELQRMTAGTGVRHSEFNPSESAPVHFYQIWLLPESTGLSPGYEQRAFPEAEKDGKWRLVASRGGRDGSLTVHQDAEVFLAVLRPGQVLRHELRPGRHAWLQALRGRVEVNGQVLDTSDGAAVSDERVLTVRGVGAAEVMLFDLA
jgi:redox-sensitive bicupin YhaK (pirin superfamily)